VLEADTGTCECDVGFGRVSPEAPCTPCDGISYKIVPGNGPCQRCPPFAVSSNLVSCRCDNSHYATSPAGAAPAKLECTECPRGGDCSLGELRATRGFFRPESIVEDIGSAFTDGPSSLLRCFPPTACLEGGECASGHTGFLCAKCESLDEDGDGKFTVYSKTASGKCTPCPGPDYLIIMLVILPLLLLLLAYLYRASSRERHAKITISLNYLQFAAQLGLPSPLLRFFKVFDLSVLDVAPDSCVVPGGYTGEFFFFFFFDFFFYIFFKN
jgi:hypothetical protein